MCRILSQTITCQLHKEGCKWTGELNDYKKHVTEQCLFPKQECDFCLEHVNRVDMNAHTETDACENKCPVFVDCPLYCEHQNQEWIMESHTADECPNSPIKCVLGNDCSLKDSKEKKCDEHHRICVSKNNRRIFDCLQNQCQETFCVECKWKNDFNKEIYRCGHTHFIQNKFNVQFEFYRSKRTGHLEITVIENNFDNWGVGYINDFWKKTTVTVKMINQTTTDGHIGKKTITSRRYLSRKKRVRRTGYFSNHILFSRKT